MEKLCRQATDVFIKEIKKDDVQCKIQDEVLDPIVKYIGNKLYPYIIGATIVLCLFSLILLYSVFLIYKINKIRS